MLFAGNMIRQLVFDSIRASVEGCRAVGELPNTDRITNDAFWIGVHPGMTDGMLAHMANVIFFAGFAMLHPHTFSPHDELKIKYAKCGKRDTASYG